LLVFLPGRHPRRRVRENTGFVPVGRANGIGPRTFLKWDYNLEIHTGEGASEQARLDGNGR
jgi:hypothetical protein